MSYHLFVCILMQTEVDHLCSDTMGYCITQSKPVEPRTQVSPPRCSAAPLPGSPHRTAAPRWRWSWPAPRHFAMPRPGPSWEADLVMLSFELFELFFTFHFGNFGVVISDNLVPFGADPKSLVLDFLVALWATKRSALLHQDWGSPYSTAESQCRVVDHQIRLCSLSLHHSHRVHGIPPSCCLG